MHTEDIEFYATIGLSLFTVWFIVDTIRYYFGAKRRLRQMHRFAKEGEVDSQYQLAKHYQKGSIVKKSCQNAAFWYQKAAFAGNAKAKAYREAFLAKYQADSEKSHSKKC